MSKQNNKTRQEKTKHLCVFGFVCVGVCKSVLHTKCACVCMCGNMNVISTVPTRTKKKTKNGERTLIRDRDDVVIVSSDSPPPINMYFWKEVGLIFIDFKKIFFLGGQLEKWTSCSCICLLCWILYCFIANRVMGIGGWGDFAQCKMARRLFCVCVVLQIPKKSEPVGRPRVHEHNYLLCLLCIVGKRLWLLVPYCTFYIG